MTHLHGGFTGKLRRKPYIYLMQTTVNPEEVAQFSRLAEQWWDPHGPFKPLHAITPLRVGYIRDHIAAHFKTGGMTPLTGLALLDIGCGGGLVCEPMARLGAQVTGIDAAEKNIKTASVHAAQGGLDIDYRCASAEALLATTPASYDVVLALEVVEHVADVELFVRSCFGLCKPGGLVIFSTISRTLKSYALAIVGAEYVLRWLPRGTHDWNTFLRPSELLASVERAGGTLVEMQGMVMNPLTFKWRLTSQDLDVNYLMVAVKHIPSPSQGEG